MNHLKLLFLAFFAVIIIAIGFCATPKAGAVSYSNFVRTVNNDRQIGNPDAPVTIIIYTDFQCYWCRKFEENDLPGITANYVKTGKIFIQFRDFPLTLIHKYAFKGAEYADCAAFQGKYMPVRSLLYKYQNDWSAIGDLYYFLKTRAKGIINLKKEESCVRSGLAKRLIKSNMSSGMNAKVSGTPTLFIYQGLILYKKVTGYKPFPVINKILKGALQ
ncbi:MAG: DsbA family protein [Deltaproteobacteria bacterium]|nr:DsbA family protein [Deltaproteobacteria bacterium]